MELIELDLLSKAKASDFEIQHIIGTGQNGLVVAARCHLEGHPNPSTLYAVKLLFNFTHEYSSVVRNAYENEWLLLSRLLPQRNIVRFWAQFISTIPDSFIQVLPTEVQKYATRKNQQGQYVQTKGQFLVLDYHPQDLSTWMSDKSFPLSFETVLKLTEQLLNAAQYLERNCMRHLDLKLSNLLLTDEGDVVVCDFGHAVKFADDSFQLPYSHGMLPGGNRAHLAPEVLNKFHVCRQSPQKYGTNINYSAQASFALGILVSEISTGAHPLPDYPLGYTTENESIKYSQDDLSPLPSSYPKSFCSIVQDLLTFDPEKRLSISEALNQLNVCCIRKSSNVVPNSEGGNLKRLKNERDLARAKLSSVGAERDFAVSEMKKMAEQCQTIVSEFQAMADHCELMLKEIEQLRLDRDNAIQASESAYEASELLREQLSLVTRDRDLARSHVEELREITTKCQPEEPVLDCTCCHKFYLESQNLVNSCNWHTGVRTTTTTTLPLFCLYINNYETCGGFVP